MEKVKKIPGLLIRPIPLINRGVVHDTCVESVLYVIWSKGVGPNVAAMDSALI